MHSDRMELDARYERIYQAWIASGIPRLVWDTSHWEIGFQVILDWYYRHDVRLGYASDKDKDKYRVRSGFTPREAGGFRPARDATWHNEVHVFSHMCNPDGGHSLKHVAIEEEGTQLVLEWWATQVRTTVPTD